MEAIPGIDWLAWLKELGVVAALVWYLWYTQSVSIPSLAKSFRETLDLIVGQFREDLKEERRQRSEEIKLLRDAFRCNGKEE